MNEHNEINPFFVSSFIKPLWLAEHRRFDHRQKLHKCWWRYSSDSAVCFPAPPPPTPLNNDPRGSANSSSALLFPLIPSFYSVLPHPGRLLNFPGQSSGFCPSLCPLSLLFLSFRAVTAVLCRRPRFSGQFLQNVFLVNVCYFIGLHRFTYCTVSIGGLVALVFSWVVILGSFADAITVLA